MAKLRVEDLGNREFEIARSTPPILQGQRLGAALTALEGKKVFLGFDRTIDGPQTASRLIRETLTPVGASFTPALAEADIAVWIGGTGNMQFAFVVLDASDHLSYRCYLCGPRELTAAIMSTMAGFTSKPRWWQFWR